jgi:hypothetical protein
LEAGTLSIARELADATGAKYWLGHTLHSARNPDYKLQEDRNYSLVPEGTQRARVAAAAEETMIRVCHQDPHKDYPTICNSTQLEKDLKEQIDKLSG